MRQSLADMLAAASYFRNLLADISLFTREMRKADMIDVNDDVILLVCCATLHCVLYFTS